MSSDPHHSLQTLCPHCGAKNRLSQARLGEAPRCGRCHERLFTGEPLVLTSANFARFIQHEQLPLLVDFWAPWCGPCRSMAPAFADAARQFSPQVRFAKLDTEANPDIAAAQGIRSIPTLSLFRGGQRMATQAGALPPAALQQWLRQQLGSPMSGQAG